MSILLTSFKKSKKYIKIFPDVYSVSRWQPYMYHYDVLDFLAAYDIDGERLRLKGSTPDQYKHELYQYYVSRRKEVNDWLISLDNDVNIMLCCWCPYSKTTKKHIKKKGSFICHTGLIGKLVNKYRPDIEIILDQDRHLKLYKPFKPDKYKIL